ncbi:MAG TPA: sulfatase-like hydrolase/transferase, partial [Methylomirabilota bacterium]|nr:sulfatase-like hydrolase/transferase [Methylomirabilota bacterium]
LRFTQFYNAARCWPTRTALLTGYYPHQVRADPPAGRLPAWAPLLPQRLKAAGYRCYHSGKWHVPGAPRALADGGFDRSYRLEDHDRNFHPRNVREDDQPLPPVATNSGYYTTTAVTDHAIRCLKEHAVRHRDRPFFAYLAFTVPHFPLHALPEDIARYRERYQEGWDAIRERRARRLRALGIVTNAPAPRDPDVVPHWNLPEAQLRERIGADEVARAVAWADLTPAQRSFQAAKMAVHAAMVDRMDREIGRVLDQLRDMGAFENTVILFASDNGASAEQIIRGDGHDPTAPAGAASTFLCLGPGWSSAANSPFRLHKSWVHEGGIATPLIVHWPAGLREKGALRHDPGHVIDLVPTLLELAGLSAPATAAPVPALPGRSLVPAFARDGAVTREFLFFHHDHNRALRMGEWKVVTRRPATNTWSLFNLALDRGETTDLAAREPVRVREMAARWAALEEEFRAQAGIPTPRR